MSSRTKLLILAFAVNLILALIYFYYEKGGIPFTAQTAGYLLGYTLIYWLRPFLFVGLVYLFYQLSNREFNDQVAVTVYSVAWLVMAIGMFYF